MSTSQAVIVVGVSLVITTVTITVMMRLNRIALQRTERRRAAWKAEGGDGPCPGDGIAGYDFNGIYF